MLQHARFDSVSNLLHELQIKGLPRGWIEFEDHGKCTIDSVQ